MSAPPSGSVPRSVPGDGAAERRQALMAAFRQTQTCVRCPELAATRNKVVFGAGNADAELMFVGEAPGASEDQEGVPFVGRAGKLLERLLGEIGLARSDVFIANVLKCRPPGNRDPLPVEIDNCREFLFAQVELVAPRVICSLGNFSTKLLRRDPAGITRVHGQPEIINLGRRAVRLYPIFHPAAALYTPRMLEILRKDFAALPALLALAEPDQPESGPGPRIGALGAQPRGATPTPGVEPVAAPPGAPTRGLPEVLNGAGGEGEAEERSERSSPRGPAPADPPRREGARREAATTPSSTPVPDGPPETDAQLGLF